MAREWPKTQKKATNIYQKLSDEKAHKIQTGTQEEQPGTCALCEHCEKLASALEAASEHDLQL